MAKRRSPASAESPSRRAGEKETGARSAAARRAPSEARAGEPAFDLGARLDADRLIGDVAEDPRAGLDDQGARRDRAFDRAGEPRVVGMDDAGDDALVALDELGAADVAVDAAVDMELGVGGEIAADDGFRGR